MRVTIFLLLLIAAPASATTCSEAVQNCISAGHGKNIAAGCRQAGAACMKTARFTGPVTGTRWDNLVRH
jgi:hypothetical protein